MIKRSITVAQFSTSATQIAEYTWMKQQEELLFQPPPSTFKQWIFDNFELFIIIVLLFQLLSLVGIVKLYRAKQRHLSEIALRKESSASEEFSLHNSRKPSHEEEYVKRQDRSNSTESSPSISPKHQIVLKSQFSSCHNNLSLNGPLLKQKSEQTVEIERDSRTNIITKKEIRTLVQQLKATDEVEKQIQEGLSRINQQTHNTQQIRGVRFVEESDFTTGQFSNCAFVTTEWSKYCENGKFEKMYGNHTFMGKGAYGEVLKAQKYLDQKFYAIKRIFFRVNQESNLREHKIFREIHALSEINHKNIVRYFTSWIEEIDNDTIKKIEDLKQYVEQKQQQQLSQSSHQQSFRINDDLDYLDDIVQFQGEQSVPQSKQITITNKNKNNSNLDSFHISDYSSVNQSVMRRLQFNPYANSQLYILHIEMELCEKTLRDFIDHVDRNKDLQLIQKIFIQLLEGIHFMHSKNYIHRDLKPQNIFINSKNEVKIGDLGLSLGNLIQRDHYDGIDILQGDLTQNIGTPAYMAPEVQENQNYNQSADIFAIGIILFELYWQMKTDSQRYRIQLKMVCFHKRCGNFTLNNDPLRRPNAQDLLKLFNEF